MIFEIYILIIIIGIATTLYSILYEDKENFTHIVSGFIGGIVWFIAGYQAYLGIDYQNVIENSTYSGGLIISTVEAVELTTYQYSWLGMLFVIAGVITVLYTVVQAINIYKDMIKELEGKDGEFWGDKHSSERRYNKS